MRTSRSIAVVAFLAAFSCSAVAFAKNAIELENEKPVDPVKDSWLPPLDPVTYEAKNLGINGIIDVYPSSWSVANGETLGVRVSTTASKFRTRIYRIGWYSAVGSRLIADVASTPGERQPFPAENDQTGLAEPNWHDSLTVPITADFPPGQYAIRVTTDTGMEGFSHFIVRDDASATKAPIIYVETLLTEQAYNPWPKIMDSTGTKQLSGKSTYTYNSMGVLVKASGNTQAVEVSLARPGGENWGLGIWRDWTVPTVQFLEKHGYDVAYANSMDMDAGYVLGGRKMWMDAGHDEYWTVNMWSNLASSRDKGLNLAWFSGNDLSWQVRVENGIAGKHDKMVAYKIAAYPDEGRCGSCWDWGGDPEFVLAQKAAAAGSTADQITHLKNVTYAWAGLKNWDPNAPSPVFPGMRGAQIAAPAAIAKLAIGFEGLMNGPKLPVCPKTATPDNVCHGVPWIVDNADHWIYTGAGVTGGMPSGLANNDQIPMIVGYEMDNARLSSTYSGRPSTQVILGHSDAVFTPDKGSATDFTGQFNAQYYQAKNGAHVFAAGTINWFWGVERDGAGPWGGIDLKKQIKPGLTIDQAITAMTINVLNKMQEGPGTPPTPAPPTDAGTPSTDSSVPSDDAGSPATDTSVPSTPGTPGGPGNPGTPQDPGTPGSPGNPGTPSDPTNPQAGGPDGTTHQSGGCAVTSGASNGEGFLAMLALGAAGLILARRKR